MELNRNSISAKLYRWFYDENKMPSNLCPYFWKLVLMWIFIIPFSIISTPVIILEKVKQDEFRYGNILCKILFSIICYTGLFIIITMLIFLTTIWFISNTTFKHYNFIYAPGLLFNISVLVWLIYLGINKIVNCYVNKKYCENKEKVKTNIIKEFIKAKYNKYCPKIDWKETSE